MKKKSVVILSLGLICVLAISAVALLNPQEACACLPLYIEELFFVYDAAKITISEAVSVGSLDYDPVLLQFGSESMELFKEKVTWDRINPYDVWLKINDNTIVEFLYKTERTLEYAGIFARKQTIYLVINSVDQGYEVFTSRPTGW